MTRSFLGVLLCAALLGACDGPRDALVADDAGPVPTMPDPSDDPPLVDDDGDGYVDLGDPTGALDPEWTARLAERELNYGAALRTASLRLRGTLPSLLEIRYLDGAADPRVAYEELIDQFLDSPLFVQRLLDLYRDTFRMGGGALESAPVFAAQLVAEDRDFTELLTAASGTCPTYDREANTFTAADCDGGVATHAGLLTHPAVLRHFDSNLAFRRVRWVQEIFACTPFPAEIGTPTDIGGAAPYTAPWDFDSIAGAESGGRIDFLDISSVTCANCHATMNHIAPLFGTFDEQGRATESFAVRLPLDDAPRAVRTDWLPEGEPTAWRFGELAADLPALGRAMAADDDVHRCTITRLWNWAMGHGDVISNVESIPDPVIRSHVDAYVAGGHRVRAAIRAIFTGPDFVRF